MAAAPVTHLVRASRPDSAGRCTSTSAKEGARAAIQLLGYASVKNDTPLPGTTYVNADLITADTFGSYKDKLCHK